MSNLKITPQADEVKQDISLSDVMDLVKKQWEELQSLKKENEILTQKLDPWYEIRQSREKYEWPRKYSYSMISWKPIVSWKTVSDQQYQNPYTKKWEAKQEIEVTYYNGKKEVFDIVPYGNLLTKSEKMFAKELIQKGSKTFLTFEKDWIDFEVELTFIN